MSPRFRTRCRACNTHCALPNSLGLQLPLGGLRGWDVITVGPSWIRSKSSSNWLKRLHNFASVPSPRRSCIVSDSDKECKKRHIPTLRQRKFWSIPAWDPGVATYAIRFRWRTWIEVRFCHVQHFNFNTRNAQAWPTCLNLEPKLCVCCVCALLCCVVCVCVVCVCWCMVSCFWLLFVVCCWLFVLVVVVFVGCCWFLWLLLGFLMSFLTRLNEDTMWNVHTMTRCDATQSLRLIYVAPVPVH